MSRRLLKTSDVLAVMGVSRTTLHRLRQDREHNGFPEQINLTASRPGWWEDEIVNWIDSRREARPASLRNSV